jgi:surface polysaccharide O-acyltransferase-like enzyme
MFNKSDYFILLAVMLSFVISAYLWFVMKDPQQAIFTAIWIPAIFTFGIYFKLCALMGRRNREF